MAIAFYHYLSNYLKPFIICHGKFNLNLSNWKTVSKILHESNLTKDQQFRIDHLVMQLQPNRRHQMQIGRRLFLVSEIELHLNMYNRTCIKIIKTCQFGAGPPLCITLVCQECLIFFFFLLTAATTVIMGTEREAKQNSTTASEGAKYQI